MLHSLGNLEVWEWLRLNQRFGGVVELKQHGEQNEPGAKKSDRQGVCYGEHSGAYEKLQAQQ